jgi:hypothetical protein
MPAVRCGGSKTRGWFARDCGFAFEARIPVAARNEVERWQILRQVTVKGGAHDEEHHSVPRKVP